MKYINLPYSCDQFGYYTVGSSFKTYSKLTAIEEMARTGQHLEWHFNQEQYSNFNWKNEPAEDIQELYRRRALEIREQYDYIVLWYSGAPDSWCMLDAFLKNGIHVDEIAHYVSLDGDGDRHSVMNEEIYFNALPKVEKIVAENPSIKHRVVDISDIMRQVYLRPDVMFDYIYNIKGIMSANSLARSYIREYVPEYRAMLDSGKRVCFLWGAEKPRVHHINGRYHVMFIDVFSETNLRLQSMVDQGYHDEWFYWAPTTAPLVAKQCHILLKLLRMVPADLGWLTEKPHGAHNPRHHPTGRYLRNDIYHTAIYPGWDPTTLVAPKPQNLMLSERDGWFWKQKNENNSAAWYAWGGIESMVKKIGDYWLNDPNDISRGIKGCVNIYPLE